MARLLAEGNRLLYTPVVDRIPAEGKNTRFTGLGEFEEYYYNYREWVIQLAFLYQMTGDEKYAEKSFEFADALCDLHTWVIRAHQFPIISSRVWPWNVPVDQVVFNSDIRNGSMARILGTVYDWLYPALDKRQRDRIRGALLEKAILPVHKHWDYHWWAHAYRCNWIGRCADGVGVAALALLTENPELIDAAIEAYNRLWRFYDEIGVDGGWQEGVGYWYGLHHCTYFADSFKRITSGKCSLFDNPRFKANPGSFPLHCFIPPDGQVDFCDGHFHIAATGRAHTFNKIAAETADAGIAWYRENILGKGDSFFDIIWPRPDITPELPVIPSIHFRTIDWSVMRSDFTDPENIVVACKGGNNSDPHHGHLDIGQVCVYWRGEGYLGDLGAMQYDEQYFDETRWNYVHAASRGHNLIFVNGEEQLPGKLKGEVLDESIGGKILEFRTSDTRDYTLIDPTGAYAGEHLKGWRRHVVLEKNYPFVLILDEVFSEKGAEIEALFHSQGQFEVKKTFTLIHGEKGIMALIPLCSDGNITIQPGSHPHLPVRTDVMFERIPYVGTVVKASNERTILAHSLLPVEPDAEANFLAPSAKLFVEEDGSLRVAFGFGMPPLTFHFQKQPDGFILEK